MAPTASGTWISADHNLLIAIIASFFILIVLYYGISEKWRPPKLIISLVPVLFILVIIFLPRFLLPSFSGEVPDEPIDYIIFIEARIKPWVFNITSIEDKNGVSTIIDRSKYVTIEGGPGFAASVAYTTIELTVGYLYKLVFRAIDTDHGVMFSGVYDYWGSSIHEMLPQHKDVPIYIKPTSNDIGTYNIACIFYCGAGHGSMVGKLIIRG